MPSQFFLGFFLHPYRCPGERRSSSSAFSPSADSSQTKLVVPITYPPLPASQPIFADGSTPSDFRLPPTGPASHLCVPALLFTAQLASTLETPNPICQARPTYLPYSDRALFALPAFSLATPSFFMLPLDLFDRSRLFSKRSSWPDSAGAPLAIASFSVRPPLTFVSSLAPIASFAVRSPLTFVSSLAHVSLSVTSSSRRAASVSVLRLLASEGAAFMLRLPAAS